MISAPDLQPEQVEYPAEFHFRIICDSSADLIDSINMIACKYTVTQDLNASKTSTSGKYLSYSISIIFDSRPQMISFDMEMKSLPGLRMLL
ncbi:MAG: DUF493 family protein [Kiritimatiellae bacterium]|jgi:putative lipoic acid-binding regulatory protein|nr:DUF493 family protein [Kiritimatiellia bacterium]